jgi:hypothetical protein
VVEAITTARSSLATRSSKSTWKTDRVQPGLCVKADFHRSGAVSARVRTGGFLKDDMGLFQTAWKLSQQGNLPDVELDHDIVILMVARVDFVKWNLFPNPRSIRRLALDPAVSERPALA